MTNIVRLTDSEEKICECCGSKSVRMSWKKQSFDYLDGESQVSLEARVPVWSCSACGDQYTDATAEEYRHDAVCRYLGRLTPKEVRGIRERYGKSQAEWAEATRLGIASVKRWETGALIQGAAQDMYLRLLAIPSNWGAIQKISRPTAEAKPEWQTSISKEQRQAAQVFQLRRSALLVRTAA